MIELTIEEQAQVYAYEEMVEYEQGVGYFYMADPYELDAANQVYEEAYERKLAELKAKQEQ